ncbi:MAG: hypothetical protein KatS3mg055_3545 [Chloroflexus sp.]|uniref:CHAT domain-containing protein n=1 Tax=Chloroflexus sp. TaxID=1904827 RepID=UPI0021DC3326|nr:CHAT domain-containing protein [Chloroflexus sp.]GIV91027.1 MAG: hypothetical protein KatS3mg055_3545 [Chloroflexus sp.]
MERAIRYYKQALEVRTRAQLPVEWAQTTHDLATAYTRRIYGERAENVERAIRYYEQALEVRTRAQLPVEWAQTMHNLANAYVARIYRERAENVERAIRYYKQALEVRTRAQLPVEWAQTTHDLATAYTRRIYGERAENVERAIRYYEQALEVRTREQLPVEWEQTTHDLANAYANRIRGERAENVERAIGYYEQALEVRTREQLPVEWAQTTHDLATAYTRRIYGERAENVERAIRYYEQALEVRTCERIPIEWAQTMHDLANAYANRIRGERAENVERAIRYYEQALEVRTRERIPIEWAQTMHDLANAYANRIRGERAENVERAIRYYEQALEVRTRERIPIEWAQTMHNLAVTYTRRIYGERAENVERAIGYYEQALEVRTRAQLPVEWAQTMHDLANAYANRILGERAENVERAIGYYEQALEVFAFELFPDNHRRVQRQLAHLYTIRGEWANAVVSARAALNANDLLYRPAPTPEARRAHLSEIQTMPAILAYALVRAGGQAEQWREAVLALERYRTRWLAEAMTLRTEKPLPVPQTVWEVFDSRRARVRELEAEAQLPYGTPGKRDLRTLSEQLRLARQELDDAITQVRSYAPDFLPEPSFDQVRQAAHDAPLIYLLTTSVGGLALIVLPEGWGEGPSGELGEAAPRPYGDTGGIIPVWLPELTEATLDGWLVQTDEASGNMEASMSNALVQLLPKLGETVMGPLAAVLQSLTPPPGPISALGRDSGAGMRGRTHRQERDEPSPSSSPDVGVGGGGQGVGVRTITLIPTGRLALLPLHAARYRVDGREVCFLDEFAVSYAPSAQAMVAARQRLATLPDSPHRLVGVGNPLPSVEALRDLHRQLQEAVAALPADPAIASERQQLTDLVARPTADLIHQDAELRKLVKRLPERLGEPVQRLLALSRQWPLSLPFARAELQSVADLLPPGCADALYEQKATHDALWERLRQATLVHFACHGSFNPDDPLRSALHLADRDLTLEELLTERRELRTTRLAVLSACQTAITDYRDLPEEAIGLPAGLLQAGAPAVVGTLWPVEDVSTALLMTRFYEYLLNEGALPAQALCAAQRWLRDLTNAELKAYLDTHRRLAEARRESAQRMPLALIEQLMLQAIINDSEQRPFADPFFWAPFTFTGVST